MAVDFLDPTQIDAAVGEAFGVKRKPAPASTFNVQTGEGRNVAVDVRFPTAKEAPAAGRANVLISDQLLDSLRNVESGGDPYAINKKTKAMGPYQFMPDTVQMLHKQGIKFNPFDEKESREAARAYLTQLAQRHNGNIELALKDYGGFVTKDPTAYVQKVTGGAAAPARASQTPGQISVEDLMKPEAVDAAVADAFNETPKLKGVGGKVTQFLRGSAALADTVLGVVPSVAGMATYAGARALGQSPEQAAATQAKVTEPLQQPVGRAFGVTETPEYKGEASQRIMQFIGENVGKGADWISQKTGMPKADVEYYMNLGMTAAPFSKTVRSEVGMAGQAAKQAGGKLVEAAAQVTPAPVRTAVRATTEAVFPGKTTPPAKAPTLGVPGQPPGAPTVAPPTPGRVSMGAAATPDATMLQQALSSATPELQQLYGNMPINKANMPAIMRDLEADSLDVPVRLTKGQKTGDVVQLSNEQNLRGSQPELAYRLNEQNQLLVDNLQARRERAAPDVFTTKTIESSQAIIDAYKALDDARNVEIGAAYKALEDANGGQFPVDGQAIARNADALLAKKLKTNFVPPEIAADLKRFRDGEPMTFEQFEALRTNLAAEARKAARAGDGNREYAVGLIRQAMEDLPLKGEAAALKPVADKARDLAKARFDALKKDPAYKAAVDDSVPADKYFNKFVINGINKHINTMIDTLGRDSLGHQHIKAGTINYLTDKAGIIDGKGNFSQANYNKAIEHLDKVNNFGVIFDPESQLKLRTLGNVAAYTQFQPRGMFANNSNTLVAFLANKAEQGGNLIGLGKFGIPAGTIVRQKIQAGKEKRFAKEALRPGAGSTLDEISKKGQ